MSILVVGSVALDSVRTPRGEARDVLGGSASYFATAARHFAPVAMVAVVGEDFPAAHRDLFRRLDIDVSGLETAPGSTFRWAGEYADDFNTRRTLDTRLNVFAEFRPRLCAAHIGSEFVFLANIHPQLQAGVLSQVSRPRFTVLDTMNYWIQGTRESLEDVLRRVDGVLLNDEEARMLTGETHLLRAARAVLELGPSLAVVKKGEHGAVVVARDFLFAVPAFPVEEVVDPTGAGDTFAGGFVGALAVSPDPRAEDALRRAAAYGTVLASFSVESFSLDRLVAATREEIEARMAALRDLVRF